MHRKKLKQLIAAGFFAISIIIWASLHLYDMFYVSTDNAYVNATVVQIAPRVAGAVTQLAITNNQFVKQGQLLFKIDAAPFKNAEIKASAQYTISKANLQNAVGTASRTHALAKMKFVSTQDNDNVSTALATAEASVNLAKATLDQAILDLSWTEVAAPTSGWVTNVSLAAGDVVTANQPLFALISNSEFWVDANFKETELENIRPGQLATIYVDMYPNHPFAGVVQSISGGTGSAFSLLPPQNATGNWVKVAQRVPVRVRVLNVDEKYPLRIGSSASVKIRLRSQYHG